ncbi:hypothetical protein AAG570_008359 [Ranatra chinensis]|uniref:Kinectin n=1 Tax=Ranatra chinensis TaxID=642074 RepID=A0ABD0XSX9_9HEMI
MDFWTGLICLIVVIFSSAIIYLISYSPEKENSFDEVKATRRKLLQRYKDETRLNNEKAKEKKSKKAKKAKEKLGEGEKQKAVALTIKDPESQSDEEKEHVPDQNDDGDRIEQVVDDSKHKKEMMVKQDVLSADKAKDIKNHKEELENEKMPSEIIVIKKDAKKAKLAGNIHASKFDGTKKHGKGEKDNSINKIVSQPTVEENALKETAQPVTKEEIKDSIVKDVIHQNVKEYLSKPILQSTSVKSGKKKKNDIASLQQLSNDKEAVNINLLMTMLQKAELSRSEIQLLIDALLNKQQEESSEWLKGRQDPLVKLKKQLAEKEKSLLDEQQASNGLQAKLRELRAELNAEKANGLQDHVNRLTGEIQEQQGICSTLGDENTLLQERLRIQECANSNVEIEKLNSYIQDIESKNVERINLDEQFPGQGHQDHVNQLSGEIKEQQGICNTLGDENTLLQERLRMQEYADSNVQIEKLNDYIQDIETKNVELIKLNEQFAGQVVMRREEAVIDSSIEPMENGDVYSIEEGRDNNLQAILKEKEAQVNQLHIELEDKENLIKHLNNEIIFCKNEENRKQILLESADVEISKLISEASVLSTQLTEKVATINELYSEVSKKKEEVISLKKDIESYKQRNNDKKKKEDLSHLKLQIIQLFHRIFPGISLEDCQDMDLWLTKVEQAALVSQSHVTNHIISDLEAQNLQLQAMITHYKSLLNDTEGILDSLQAHIEVEESRWQEKILGLQEEIESLKENQQKRVNFTMTHLFQD